MNEEYDRLRDDILKYKLDIGIVNYKFRHKIDEAFEAWVLAGDKAVIPQMEKSNYETALRLKDDSRIERKVREISNKKVDSAGDKAVIPQMEESNYETLKDDPRIERKVREISNKKVDSDFIEYTVQKKETLYRICEKFNISSVELLRLNPKLKNGVRSGMKIRIPNRIDIY